MAELKNVLREAKHSLRDLETSLQQARSMDQDKDEQYVLSREELQKYFEEMLKVLESLPENLKVEEGFEDKDEIKNLHLQMEAVRRKVEECFGRVEAACETNLQELSKFIENLCSPKPTQPEEKQVPTKMPCLNDFLSQGKSHFEDQDFEACLKVLNEALGLDPGNTEATSLLVEAQKKLEDLRLEEELVVHIENLKKEAMDQFDREQYRDCMRTFNFLCELEPKNRTLRDYLELSRQKVQEMEDTDPKSSLGERSASPPVSDSNASVPASKSLGQSPPVSSAPRIQDEQLSAVPNSEKNIRSQNTAHGPVTTATEPAKPAYPKEESSAPTSSQELPLVDEEQANPVGHQKSKKLLIASMAAVALLLLAILGLRTLVRTPKTPEASTLEIQSDPEAARVFIDGEPKGQTKLRIESLSEGSHELRLEMEGYAPLTQTFALAKGRPTALRVRLDKLAAPPPPEVNPQEEATTLFEKGDFLGANQRCDSLLQRDSQNSFALELKNKIRNYYLRQGKNAMSKSRWEEARLSLETALKVTPGDSEVSGQLKLVRTKLKKSPATLDSGEAQMAGKIQDLHQQISVAIGTANYLPPTSGNALDLIHHLSTLAPTDSFAKEKLDQVHRELLSQIQRRIQAKDFDTAKTLAQQVQGHFPESSELRNLRDTLKAEEAKLMENWSSLVQKAESALASSRYVTPATDNAFVYANRLLAIDSQNQRALALKKDSFAKAAAQGRDLIQSEKFDEAREIYSALFQFSSLESRPPFNVAELKREQDKLEFTGYPVVHDHTLMGSCTGRLRVNAYVLNFVPAGNSKDGFSAKLAEIETESPGDKLKIQVRNKTYRYEANLVKSKEENREKLAAIYEHVSELKAKAK